MDNTQTQAIDDLIKKLENGELTEEQELALLKELNFSYDVLNKFLEQVKIEQLKAEIQ
ncbi:hypothetical protein [Flavobacterium sp. UBA6046]|jgi:predicted DNA-binding protein YlxM (UPF0122 family)|uniref:hypothetical protein n=1 Tax=Flavobacterium sp. UBA6046 TaxID=1946552 RepID=UPI0025C585B5|nr:hypothetical protein [Flavobacterium sp. UBA6046]